MRTILIDDREKVPLLFPVGTATRVQRLATGDYSLAGLEHRVAVERKRPAELFSTVGAGRRRFAWAVLGILEEAGR